MKHVADRMLGERRQQGIPEAFGTRAAWMLGVYKTGHSSSEISFHLAHSDQSSVRLPVTKGRRRMVFRIKTRKVMVYAITSLHPTSVICFFFI